jgi:hypothetical protein
MVGYQPKKTFCSPGHYPLDQVKTSVLELDEATVEERQYEEYGEFDVLQEEPENIKDFAAEMSSLECTYDGCTTGAGGAKFKTPALEPAQAVEYLRFHREYAHGQHGATAGGCADKVQLSKIPRPEISGDCSQEDFKFFTRKWDQYVRSSNEKDGHKLKDQFTNCPDDTLISALYKALGDRIDTISVADLLKEIEVLAVVQQSNNINTLAMISAKQERDKPVIQFAARLRRLAAVCDLSVTCTCELKVSEVDKWVRKSLIGGRRPLKILGGKLTSGQVNKVQQDREDQRSCTYCGQKGHGKSPNIGVRKADCPAYGKKCAKCQQKGHYAGACKSRRGEKKDETQHDSKKTAAGTNNFTINMMKMSEKSGKISRVSQSANHIVLHKPLELEQDQTQQLNHLCHNLRASKAEATQRR